MKRQMTAREAFNQRVILLIKEAEAEGKACVAFTNRELHALIYNNIAPANNKRLHDEFYKYGRSFQKASPDRLLIPLNAYYFQWAKKSKKSRPRVFLAEQAAAFIPHIGNSMPGKYVGWMCPLRLDDETVRAIVLADEDIQFSTGGGKVARTLKEFARGVKNGDWNSAEKQGRIHMCLAKIGIKELARIINTEPETALEEAISRLLIALEEEEGLADERIGSAV